MNHDNILKVVNLHLRHCLKYNESYTHPHTYEIILYAAYNLCKLYLIYKIILIITHYVE